MESQEVSKLIFSELQLVQENNKCFDCGADQPKWASVNNGIFVCLECCGIHRSLGAHISFLRSVNLDAWNEKQLKCMSVGGNKKLKDFLAVYDLDNETIDYKYQTKAAEHYRKKLKACAAEVPFDEAQPEYSEGREHINFKSEEFAETLGNELKEEAKQVEGEEVKEAGDPSSEDKQRASTLIQKLMTTSLQVRDKGVHIVTQGGTYLYNKIPEGAIKTKLTESAMFAKDTGIKVAGAAVDLGTKTAVYAGEKGNALLKGIYDKAKESPQIMSAGGAVYNQAKSVGNYISQKTGVGAGASSANAGAVNSTGDSSQPPAEGEQPLVANPNMTSKPAKEDKKEEEKMEEIMK